MPYLNQSSGLGGIFDVLGQDFAQRAQQQQAYDTWAQSRGATALPSDQQPGFFSRLLGAVTGSPLNSTSMYGAVPMLSQAPPSPSPASPPSLGGASVPPGGSSAGGASATPPLSYAPSSAASPPSSAPSQPASQAYSSGPSGPLPSMAAAQGVPQGGLQNLFTSTAQNYNLPPGYLPQLAAIESKMNPNAVSSTGAAGPYQFTRGTAKDYGLTDPTDWATSTDAAARLTVANQAALIRGLGRPPTPGELYLAHQQGADGALKLLENPNARAGDVVGDKAVKVNGGDPNMPAGVFASMWTSKFGNPGPGSQATAAAGFSTPFDGSAVGPNPNGFSPMPGSGQGVPSGPLPSFAASGAGMVPQNAGFASQPNDPPSGGGTARAAARAAGVPFPQPTPAASPSQPTAYADPSTSATAPAAQAISAAAPQGQAYGSQPLNVNGQMLTRQQAEDAQGLDHTDYDAAAAKAGLISSADAAPPFVDGGAGAGPTKTPSSPIPQAQIPALGATVPGTAPATPNAAFSITPDMIGNLIKNPGTQQFGLQLWEHMLTTKTQPQIAHAGDVILDANGNPRFQIPEKQDGTDLIKNYLFAKAQGYTGSFTAFQADQGKNDKGQVIDVPLGNGQFQKMAGVPGQSMSTFVPIGVPYAKTEAGTPNLPLQSQQRTQLMQQQGRDLNDPQVQNFIATGKFQPEGNLPATVLRAISSSDDDLSNLYHARDALTSLQSINADTPGGRMVGVEQAAQRNLPGFIVPQGVTDAAVNATDFDKVVQEQMLPRLKQYFGGRPAFAADQQMLKVTPTTAMSPAERAPLLANMATRVNQLISQEETKNANLRAGTYYKPGGSGVQPSAYGQSQAPASTQPTAPPSPGLPQISAQDAAALPVISSPTDAARLTPGTMFRTPDGQVMRR